MTQPKENTSNELANNPNNYIFEKARTTLNTEAEPVPKGQAVKINAEIIEAPTDAAINSAIASQYYSDSQDDDEKANPILIIFVSILAIAVFGSVIAFYVVNNML